MGLSVVAPAEGAYIRDLVREEVARPVHLVGGCPGFLAVTVETVGEDSTISGQHLMRRGLRPHTQRGDLLLRPQLSHRGAAAPETALPLQVLPMCKQKPAWSHALQYRAAGWRVQPYRRVRSLSVEKSPWRLFLLIHYQIQ